MKKLLLSFIICILAISTLISQSLIKEDGFLYICTYNVYVFGDLSDRYKSLEEDYEGPIINRIPDRILNNANVLRTGDFDLIVLQEVKEGEAGYVAISDLVNELNKNRSQKYEFMQSDNIGYGYGMYESMGFIYNPSVIKPEIITGNTSMFDYLEASPIGGRKFVKTQWTAGDFDFTLISCHFAWGNEEKRNGAYETLESILTTPTPSNYSVDPDIIVLGDFNRFGDYKESVKLLDYNPDKFWAPNITIFDPEFNTIKQVEDANINNKGIPENNPQLLSTTIADNTFAYDIMLFTSDVKEEFPSNLENVEYGKDFGIIHFDEVEGFGYQEGANGLDHTSLKEAYSDHRPLWMRFKMDSNQSDSDSQSNNTVYVGTEHGKKFHLKGCPSIANKAITIEWNSLEEAQSERTPCMRCKPNNH